VGNVKSIIAIFAVVIFFGAGMLVGSKFPGMTPAADTVERVQNIRGKVEKLQQADESIQDHLRLSQSATAASALAESLSDPKIRTDLEKKLREVPFAVLKQIYLERQDEAWERQQERYKLPKDLSDVEIARRAEGLFEAFRQGSDASTHYISRGEVTLRAGKKIPYIEFVEYYSSRNAETTHADGLESAQTAAITSGKPEDMCYVSVLYLRVGDHYSPDSTSSCLPWAALRNERPFALHANYSSKRLVPLFDSVSIALPGFGSDRDLNSEWYDAGPNRWISLGRIHFDPVSKSEYSSLKKETELDAELN
jgi:hypothetical protein